MMLRTSTAMSRLEALRRTPAKSQIFRWLLAITLVGLLTFLIMQYALNFRSPRDEFFEKEYKDPMDDPSLVSLEQKGVRAKAAILIFAKNSELHDLRGTLRQLEDRWNKRFHYPYVFLGHKEFTEEFKNLTTQIVSGKTHYGLIPPKMWSYPSWINVTKVDEEREKMENAGVIYGGSVSYRHMCRFNSGFFFRHPLLDDYDWYWRVESSVEFSCDINYDPFLFMEKNNLIYGFTITMYEFNSTIATLWSTVKNFMAEYPQYVNPKNSLKFVTDSYGNYNLCHFWSNFEIVNLNFWRSERYLKFFEYLDKTGGFFYERWGDAPIHSIAVAMFLEKSQVHFFNDIGYRHSPFQHCPEDREKFHGTGRCHCDPDDNFDSHWYSCTKKWWEV